MPHHFSKWRDAIALAPDEGTITRLLAEYLATLTPDLLAALGEDCREMIQPLPADIQTSAVGLLQAELKYRENSHAAEVLHEVAHTFAAASVRLSQLRTDLAFRS